MNITEFFNWQTVASFGGATAVTGIFTQLLKGLFDKLPIHLPTRILSYVIAVAVLLTATFFNGGLLAGDYVICFVNGALISLSSNGTFDLLKWAQNTEDEEKKGDDIDKNNT